MGRKEIKRNRPADVMSCWRCSSRRKKFNLLHKQIWNGWQSSATDLQVPSSSIFFLTNKVTVI